MSIRVLHLLWDGDLGGVQRYVLNILKNGAWERTEHSVCCFASSGRVLCGNTLNGVTVHELNLRNGWSLSSGRKLENILSGENYNVIHAHCDTPALLLNLKRLEKYRLIYTEHGDTILRRKNVWLTETLWKLYNRCWDSMIMNSKLVEKDFLDRFPCFAKRTAVCPNPLLETRDVGRRTPRSDEKYQVGFFGRLVWQKGVDRVLMVARQVCEILPGTVFNIFGDGELLGEIQDECRRRKLEKSVVFRGYTENPLQMMAEMDCNIVPSRIEPFGLVALEALSVGTPVVGFRGTGVAEIVQHRKNGLLVAAGNTEDMAEAVIGLLSDRYSWQEMSDSAIAHARNDFRLDSHCRMLEDLYVDDL